MARCERHQNHQTLCKARSSETRAIHYRKTSRTRSIQTPTTPLPVAPTPSISDTPAPPDPIPECKVRPPPPPTLVHGVEEFDVDSILNSRFRYNRIEYLVKWKGFDIGENSWEPHYNLHCPNLVKAFHRTNPAAPQRISATSFSSIPFRPRPIPTTPAVRSTCWRSTHRDVAL